jgi:NAD(P)-dependent dehydrogenase (short-subunit alcohol dehydrogenase family)
MASYTGKTIVVTGSRGIAKGIVESLFAKGANVIIVSTSDSSEKLAASLHPAQVVDTSAKAASKPEDASLVDKTTSKLQEVLHIGSSSSSGGRPIQRPLVSAAICPHLPRPMIWLGRWLRRRGPFRETLLARSTTSFFVHLSCP